MRLTIVAGMARTKAKDIARDRVLSDTEIRALWAVIPGQGMFGKLVKTLLLTAQRRDEVAQMGRSEIDDKGVWHPSGALQDRQDIVPLPAGALAVLEERRSDRRVQPLIFSDRRARLRFLGIRKPSGHSTSQC